MKFPGMDPYLEDPRLWTGVHASMIVYVRNFLQPQLRPRYVAAIEERVYLEGTGQQRVPDVWVQKRKKGQSSVAVLEADTPVVVKVSDLEVHETYLTILDRYAENKVVTVIELVSPANKSDGPGRDSYLDKQHEVLGCKVHLVEIDLLRAGDHVVACPEWMARRQGEYQYLACVNRAKGLRNEFHLYLRTLPQPLPRVRVPLAGTDADVSLDVQAVFEQTYEDGAYAERIDYKKPCQPPLAAADQAWVRKILKNGSGNGAARPSKRRK